MGGLFGAADQRRAAALGFYLSSARARGEERSHFTSKFEPAKDSQSDRQTDSELARVEMDEDGSVSPDLKDLETKLGRKAPDSLVRSLTGGRHNDEHEKSPHLATCKFCANSADLKRLESKMLLLREEMANLRAIDVKLMQQLMSINEGIESIRWMMEDKGGVASQDGSLTGSLYSLSDSQEDSSLRGSLNSLNDGNSDGLDSLSVGSYLDTLAEDLRDDPSPTDLDCFVDKTVIDGDVYTKSLRVESDEYYCFG